MQSLAKIASRGSQGHFINATNQAVASLATTEARAASDSQAAVVPSKVIPQTRHGLSLQLPTRALVAVSGIGIRSHIRMLHTDMEVPDFSYYRRNATKDGSSKTSDSFGSRAAFTYLLSGALGVSGVYAASKTVNMFVGSMSASADVLALSKIEVNLADIPEGKSMTFKWRGKPLFVRHRTPEEIAAEQAVDVATLRDPQTDSERAQDPKFLVVVGVCTHLGCVPVSNAGEYGGYYCPCHGSHYDSSGRIRKGPAPLNLEVPAHQFVNDVLVVG